MLLSCVKWETRCRTSQEVRGLKYRYGSIICAAHSRTSQEVRGLKLHSHSTIALVDCRTSQEVRGLKFSPLKI